MRLWIRRLMIFAVLLSFPVVPQLIYADTIVIHFDDLSDGASVTNQYPGFLFSNATVYVAGISLNEFDFPPYSRTNVVSNAIYDQNGDLLSTGPMSINFSSLMSSVGGFFTYTVPLTITAFDLADNPVATATSAFLNNLGTFSTDPPNDFIQVSYAPGISRITIQGLPTQDWPDVFTLDDAKFTTQQDARPVPEPGTLSLLFVGLLAVAYTTNKLSALRQNI